MSVVMSSGLPLERPAQGVGRADEREVGDRVEGQPVSGAGRRCRGRLAGDLDLAEHLPADGRVGHLAEDAAALVQAEPDERPDQVRCDATGAPST